MTDIPSTMRAVRVHATGGPEVLAVDTIAVPQPSRGEALVRIEAAGVNFIDVYKRAGLYKVLMPATLGEEGAGGVGIGSVSSDAGSLGSVKLVLSCQARWGRQCTEGQASRISGTRKPASPAAIETRPLTARTGTTPTTWASSPPTAIASAIDPKTRAKRKLTTRPMSSAGVRSITRDVHLGRKVVTSDDVTQIGQADQR